MSNTIDPKSPTAAPAGVSPETPQTNAGPVDPNLINALTLQLALLKKTPGIPPPVIAKLEEKLDELKHGGVSAAEAEKVFTEAMSNAIHDSETDAAGVITTIMTSEAAKQSNNPLLEKIKKDSNDKDNN